MSAYTGYTIEVTTPSLSEFSEDVIKAALSHYDGATIVVTEKPGRPSPHLTRMDFPEGHDLGTMFMNGQEWKGFGQQAAAYAVELRLAKLRRGTPSA